MSNPELIQEVGNIRILHITRPDYDLQLVEKGLGNATCELCVKKYPDIPLYLCEDCALNPRNRVRRSINIIDASFKK